MSFLTWQKDPEDLWVIIERLEERVVELERKIHGTNVATFSAFGDFEERFFGTPWYAEHGYDVLDFRASLGTSGTGATTIVLYRNGVAEETLVIPSGDPTALREWDDLSLRTLVEGDHLQIECTGKGAGAEDLVVQVRMARTS
jgi:hypothetical protein